MHAEGKSMRQPALALFAAIILGASPAPADLPLSAAPDRCTAAEAAPAPREAPRIQLAQRGCRSDCSSRRGYCLSTCRDSQCRAICNDLYQSCVASCR
jgi:hypothetical protein